MMLQQTPTKGHAQVSIGTPGRILQLLEKGALRPDHLKTLVLDEADELFSQGFQEQLAKIFRFLPRDIQIVLVSATLFPMKFVNFLKSLCVLQLES